MSTGSLGGEVGGGVVEGVRVVVRGDGVSFGVFAFVANLLHFLIHFLLGVVVVVLVPPALVLLIDIHLAHGSRIVVLISSTSFPLCSRFLFLLLFSPSSNRLLPHILRQTPLRDPPTPSSVRRSGGRSTWQRRVVLVVAPRRSPSTPERSQSTGEGIPQRVFRSGRTSQRSGSAGEGRVVGVVAGGVLGSGTATWEGRVVEVVASWLAVDEIRSRKG